MNEKSIISPDLLLTENNNSTSSEQKNESVIKLENFNQSLNNDLDKLRKESEEKSFERFCSMRKFNFA